MSAIFGGFVDADGVAECSWMWMIGPGMAAREGIMSALARACTIGTPRGSAEMFRILSRNTSPASHDREPHPFDIGKMTDTINTDQTQSSHSGCFIFAFVSVLR